MHGPEIICFYTRVLLLGRLASVLLRPLTMPFSQLGLVWFFDAFFFVIIFSSLYVQYVAKLKTIGDDIQEMWEVYSV